MNPLFSVVVINYEKTHLLSTCLASVFAQTYDNIELIICDDCSCDFDPQEIEEYIAKEKNNNIKNVVVLKQDCYKGVPGNCQKGFELSNGTFIKYLMPEDSFISDSAISLAYETFVEHNTDVVVTKEEGQDMSQHYKESCVESATVFENLSTQYNETFIISYTAFIKRNIIEKVGGFDLKYEQIAFLPLWLKAAYAGAHFYCSDEQIIEHTALSVMAFQPQITTVETIESFEEILDILSKYAQETVKANHSLYSRFKYSILINRIRREIVCLNDWPFMNFVEKVVWKIRNAPSVAAIGLYNIRLADDTGALINVSLFASFVLVLLKTDLPFESVLPVRTVLRIVLYFALAIDLIKLFCVLFQKFCNRVARRNYEKK